MDQTFEKRKKIIYEFICDDMYVPMKLKELAILLQVPKEQRSELKAVMDALEARCMYLRRESISREQDGRCAVSIRHIREDLAS